MITKLLTDLNHSGQKWHAGTPVRFLDFEPGDCVGIELPNGAQVIVSARRVEAMHEPEESIQGLAEEFGIDYDTLYKAVYDGRVMARKSGKTWLSTRTAVQYAIRLGKIRATEGMMDNQNIYFDTRSANPHQVAQDLLEGAGYNASDYAGMSNRDRAEQVADFYRKQDVKLIDQDGDERDIANYLVEYGSLD